MWMSSGQGLLAAVTDLPGDPSYLPAEHGHFWFWDLLCSAGAVETAMHPETVPVPVLADTGCEKPLQEKENPKSQTDAWWSDKPH